MRELKFRAWDHQLKKILDVNQLNWFTNIPEIMVNGVLPCDKQMEIMQYTERKDSDNKEIYENDILNYIKPLLDGTEHYSVVKWDKSRYVPLATHPGTSWTVVGNIYENPELIKEKK